jgi:hypothetical protein
MGFCLQVGGAAMLIEFAVEFFRASFRRFRQYWEARSGARMGAAISFQQALAVDGRVNLGGRQ